MVRLEDVRTRLSCFNPDASELFLTGPLNRWSTYFVVAGLLSGLSYFAYLTFVPQPKKRTKKSVPAVSAPVGTVTATGAGGYQEEWIPEHHLRKGAKKAKQGGGAVSGTSGDELSGVETSGAEGKKRKGRK